MHDGIKSDTEELTIEIDRQFVIIGEKLNLTGNQEMPEALSEGNPTSFNSGQ